MVSVHDRSHCSCTQALFAIGNYMIIIVYDVFAWRHAGILQNLQSSPRYIFDNGHPPREIL